MADENAGSDSRDLSAEAAEFAPAEPTDGRDRGDWTTRFPDKLARRWIRIEAIYVASLFLSCSALALAAGLDAPVTWGWLDKALWTSVEPYALAFIGGAMGGSLFSTKWLYHSVAKEIWNIDRRLWRFFTPMLAAGAALTVVVLSAGGIVPVFGRELITSGAGALGVSLVVGYFSDRTFSLLERLATQQFGLPKGQGAD